jgi:hypothetical protein
METFEDFQEQLCVLSDEDVSEFDLQALNYLVNILNELTQKFQTINATLKQKLEFNKSCVAVRKQFVVRFDQVAASLDKTKETRALITKFRTNMIEGGSTTKQVTIPIEEVPVEMPDLRSLSLDNRNPVGGAGWTDDEVSGDDDDYQESEFQAEINRWVGPAGSTPEIRELALRGIVNSAVYDSTDCHTMKRLRSSERFDGQNSEWHEFWRGFKTNVHDNERLSISDKHLILCDRMTQQAWSALGYTEKPSRAQYGTVICDIIAKFKRTASVTELEIKRYERYQPIRSNHEEEDLNKLRVALTNTRNRLEKTSEGKVICDNMILPKVFQLVGTEVRNKFYDGRRKTLAALTMAIARRIDDLQLCPLSDPMYHASNEVKRPPALKSIKTTHTAVVNSHSCPFCQSNDHTSDRCRKFVGYEQRIEQVKKLNLCFKCLKPGHFSQDCRKTNSCAHCGKPHRSDLCKRQQGSNSNISRKPSAKSDREPNRRHSTTQMSRSSSNRQSIRVEDEPEPSTSSGTSTYAVISPASTALAALGNGQVFLRTIVGKIVNGNRSTHATIFLDCGSTDSYISQRLVDKLGMRTSTADPLTIGGFGNTATTVSKVANVVIHSVDDEPVESRRMRVTNFVYRVPTERPTGTLAKEIANKGVVLKWDDSLPENEADILLGIASVNRCGELKKILIRGDLYATLTKLGWTLGGSADCDSSSVN